MRKLTFFYLLLFMPLMAFAQDAEEAEAPEYKMVQHVHMTVDADNVEAFEAAVKKHNEMFHSGKYGASLYSIATGADAGMYIWAMGRLTFTDLDSRPSGDAHDSDWKNNVAPYIESTESVEYWRLGEKLSYEADEETSMIQIWWVDLEQGEGYRFRSMMEKIKEIHAEKNESISVWWNQFNEQDGRDAAIVWPIENWADFDNNEWSMSDAYDEKYGEGSWDNAMEEWEDAVKSVKRVLWSVVD